MKVYIYNIFIIDNFSPKSSITVNAPIEIEKITSYKFTLYSTTDLETDVVFKIELPEELGISGFHCSPYSCTFDGQHIIITEILPTKYLANSRLPIEFTISSITNPRVSYMFNQINIRVSCCNSTMCYNSGMIPISNTERYETHNFHMESITHYSESTVTNTTYQFVIKNQEYILPAGTVLRIQFPDSLGFLSATPNVTLQYCLHQDKSVQVCLGGNTNFAFNNHGLDIWGAFPSNLSINSSIILRVGDILNPYKLGNTDSFYIYGGIKVEDVLYLVFKSKEEIFVHINYVTRLSPFTIDVSGRITNRNIICTFNIQLGAGSLNTSHAIQIKRPDIVPYCNPSSMVGKTGISFEEEVELVDDNNYKFIIAETVAANAIVSFEMYCTSPYTIRPIITKFFIYIMDKTSNNQFYLASNRIPSMLTVGNFTSLEVIPENYESLNINQFTFVLQTGYPKSNLSNTIINEIKIQNQGVSLIDRSPILSDPQGFGGSPICVEESGHIYIKEFTSLNTNFSFKLGNFRNLGYASQSSTFIVITKHSDNFLGQKSTSAPFNTKCHFPCKSCPSTAEAQCTECYILSGEVLNTHGTSLYILYNNSCIASCPNKTYPYNDLTIGPSCGECSSECEECENSENNCTKCYAGKFLSDSKCIDYPCPEGYEANKDLNLCDNRKLYIYIYIDYFWDDSEIRTVNSTVINAHNEYNFTLRPCCSELPTTTVFHIELPESKGMSITSPCAVTPIGSCEVSSSTIQITGILQEPYTNWATFVTFQIANITNPNITYQFQNTTIKVTIYENSSATEFKHQRLIPVNEYISDQTFDPHPLADFDIGRNSKVTVTETKYKFSFKNANYTIEEGSEIKLYFPSCFLFTDPNPTLSRCRNISDGTTATFAHNGNDDPTMVLYLREAFDEDLAPNSLIRFEIDHILNPYKLTDTEYFQINIYNQDSFLTFLSRENLYIGIAEIASFSNFVVTTETQITSSSETYAFAVALSDGGLNSSHHIELEIPSEVQGCKIYTFTSNIFKNCTYIRDIYSFELLDGLPANSPDLVFTIVCKNPFTIRPSSPFRIWAKNVDNTAFYASEANIWDMTQLDNFAALTVTPTLRSPRVANSFDFFIQTCATYDLSSDIVNQIIITVNAGIEIIQCEIFLSSGIAGAYSCNINEQVITISEFSSLSPIISFTLNSIRNPSLTTSPIIFTVSLSYFDGTNGYVGASKTTENINVSCNFPCKTCLSTNPDICESCYNQGHEVFDIDDIELYLLRGDNCVGQCQLHYYFGTSSCLSCNSTCDECAINDDNCIKCRNETYLNSNRCYTNCTSGFIEDRETWTCLSNYIYIYIY